MGSYRMNKALIALIALFAVAWSVNLPDLKVESLTEEDWSVIGEELRAIYPATKHRSKEEMIGFAKIFVQAHLEAEEPEELGNLVPFNCSAFGRNGTVPTNVNQLRISDIDVVMAMGDSITAAFGAQAGSILSVFNEYRGISWSIGGIKTLDTGVLTVPNLIRQYNPNVVGFSVGTGKATTSNAKLNQAVSGAVATDMPAQAATLVNLAKSLLTQAQFQQGWKVMTLFVGGNDLCAWCNDNQAYGSVNYYNKVIEALTVIKNNIPRVLVNLVPTIDVTQLYEVSGFTCSLLHSFECSCGTSSNSGTRSAVSQESLLFHDQAEKIQSFFQGNDTFTVVTQPFMTLTHLPRLSNGSPDKSYFAPDCFHFSEKAHQAAAVALWNNMNEKVGNKDESWEGPKEQIHCPLPTDLIWTPANS